MVYLQGRLESLTLDAMVMVLYYGALCGSEVDVDSFLRKYGRFCVDLCMQPCGRNALHAAAATGKAATVRVLLAAGADVHARSQDGEWTALLLACRYQVWGACVHGGVSLANHDPHNDVVLIGISAKRLWTCC